MLLLRPLIAANIHLPTKVVTWIIREGPVSVPLLSSRYKLWVCVCLPALKYMDLCVLVCLCMLVGMCVYVYVSPTHSPN